MHPEIKAAVPPHLQIGTKLKKGERDTVLRSYPAFDQFPEPIEDHNRLANKAFGEGPTKNLLLRSMPKFMRDQLDVARIAARELCGSAGAAG